MSQLPPSSGPGQPPHDPAQAQQGEVLEQGAGAPLAAEPRPRRRRTGLLVGGGVAALLVVGGGSAAAYWYTSSGSEAAEAVPADAIGYLGVNLDPSGQQKLEALQTLKKFPAIADKLNLDGDLGDVDVKKSTYDALGSDVPCGLTYDADFKSWVGDRAAVAALPASGSGDPTPLLVVEVTDTDAAQKTMSKISSCGGFDDAGYALENGWLTIADTSQDAKKAADDAADAPLSDDADFQRLTSEAGDGGIMTMYAAPDALKTVMDSSAMSGQDTSGMQSAVDRFQGAAGSVRFADDGLQVDVAGSVKDADSLYTDNDVAGLVGSLPTSTAAAWGFSVPERSIEQVFDSFATVVGAPDGQALEDQLGQQTGLSLPDDLTTLLGKGVVVSVDSSLDPQEALSSGDPSSAPVGLKVAGDPSAIQAVLDKVQAQLGPQASILDSDSGDGFLAVGPNSDYRSQLTSDGGLGSSATYESVVPDADQANGVLFVDADAVQSMVEKAMSSGSMGDSSSQEVLDNLEPLRAMGVSTRTDGDTVHLTMRVSTN